MGKALIDVASLTGNVGDRSYSGLPPQYGARKVALRRLEKEARNLIKKKKAGTATKTELSRLKALPREIKGVTLTDPEVLFYQYKGEWKYSKEANWKIKGDPIEEGLKPLESHHKAGLDKYYSRIKGWGDDEIFNLHQELEKQGKYLGNHPGNRIQLDSSLHVGRARQFTPGYESIHGVLDYTDLTEDEWGDLVTRVADEDVDYVKTDFDFDSDIGSPGDPKGPRRQRLPLRSPESFEFGTPDDVQEITRMMDKDYQLADEFSQKTPKTKLAFKGKSLKLSDWIKRNEKNRAFWPEDTEQAIENIDTNRLKQIENEIEVNRSSSMMDAFDSGETLPSWKSRTRGVVNRFIDTTSPLLKTTTGLSRAESAVRIAGGDYVGGAAGLAMTTPTFQKQAGKLLAKQGIKLIPGLSFGSGALQAMGYLSKGQWTKAGLSAVGGVIGEFGPAGDAVQAAIDLGLTGHDVATGDINHGLELEDELEEANLLKKGTKNIRSVARNL